MGNKRFREIVDNLNNFLGGAAFLLGIARAIVFTMVIIQVGTTAATIFNDVEVKKYEFGALISIVHIVQILIWGVSPLMIILNIKHKPGVAMGFLMIIGTVIIEMIVGGILAIFVYYTECAIFMKAGNMITKKNEGKSNLYI